MDVAQGEAQRNQPFFPEDVVRKGLFHLRQRQVQRPHHQFVHHLPRDARVLEFLGTGVHAGQHARALLPFRLLFGRCRRVVNLRMNQVDASLEGFRLAEKDKGRSRLQPGFDVLQSLEKDQFQLAGSVLYPHTQPFSAHEFRRFHPGENLDERHVGRKVGNAMEGAPVDVPERIEADQVADGFHTQLTAQKSGPFRPYPAQVLDLRFHSALVHRLYLF